MKDDKKNIEGAGGEQKDAASQGAGSGSENTGSENAGGGSASKENLDKEISDAGGPTTEVPEKELPVKEEEINTTQKAVGEEGNLSGGNPLDEPKSDVKNESDPDLPAGENQDAEQKNAAESDEMM